MFFLEINFTRVNFVISKLLFPCLSRNEIHLSTEALIYTTWQPSWERSPSEILLFIAAGNYNSGVPINYLFLITQSASLSDALSPGYWTSSSHTKWFFSLQAACSGRTTPALFHRWLWVITGSRSPILQSYPVILENR